MIKISKKKADLYVKRWKTVQQVQLKELRSSSLEQKFKQLCVLMDSRPLFGKRTEGDRGVKQVRQHWVKLRKAMNNARKKTASHSF